MRNREIVIRFRVPTILKRKWLWLLAGAIVSVGAVAYAGDFIPFAPGEKLSAAAMNENFAALQSRIAAQEGAVQTIIPPGTIVAYGGPKTSTPPVGWLFCDGAAVPRSGNTANLFASIKIAWGGGDGTSTFNVPDLRGRFLRGTDNGVTPPRDFDRSTRTSSQLPGNMAGNAGDLVGSMQSDGFKSHAHGGATGGDSPDHSHGFGGYPFGISYGSSNTSQNLGTAPNGFYRQTDGASARHTHSVSSEGVSETRPTNVGVNYIIKL